MWEHSTWWHFTQRIRTTLRIAPSLACSKPRSCHCDCVSNTNSSNASGYKWWMSQGDVRRWIVHAVFFLPHWPWEKCTIPFCLWNSLPDDNSELFSQLGTQTMQGKNVVDVLLILNDDMWWVVVVLCNVCSFFVNFLIIDLILIMIHSPENSIAHIVWYFSTAIVVKKMIFFKKLLFLWHVLYGHGNTDKKWCENYNVNLVHCWF